MTYRDRRRDRRERSLRGLRESVLRGCCWLEIGRAVSTSVGGEVFFRIANGVGIARGARVERASAASHGRAHLDCGPVPFAGPTEQLRVRRREQSPGARDECGANRRCRFDDGDGAKSSAKRSETCIETLDSSNEDSGHIHGSRGSLRFVIQIHQIHFPAPSVTPWRSLDSIEKIGNRFDKRKSHTYTCPQRQNQHRRALQATPWASKPPCSGVVLRNPYREMHDEPLPPGAAPAYPTPAPAPFDANLASAGGATGAPRAASAGYPIAGAVYYPTTNVSTNASRAGSLAAPAMAFPVPPTRCTSRRARFSASRAGRTRVRGATGAARIAAAAGRATTAATPRTSAAGARPGSSSPRTCLYASPSWSTSAPSRRSSASPRRWTSPPARRWRRVVPRPRRGGEVGSRGRALSHPGDVLRRARDRRGAKPEHGVRRGHRAGQRSPRVDRDGPRRLRARRGVLRDGRPTSRRRRWASDEYEGEYGCARRAGGCSAEGTCSAAELGYFGICAERRRRHRRRDARRVRGDEAAPALGGAPEVAIGARSRSRSGSCLSRCSACSCPGAARTVGATRATRTCPPSAARVFTPSRLSRSSRRCAAHYANTFPDIADREAGEGHTSCPPRCSR